MIFRAGGDVDTHLLQIGVRLTNPSTRAIVEKGKPRERKNLMVDVSWKNVFYGTIVGAWALAMVVIIFLR